MYYEFLVSCVYAKIPEDGNLYVLHIHTHALTYIHTYIHTYIQTYIHTDIQTYRHTDI